MQLPANCKHAAWGNKIRLPGEVRVSRIYTQIHHCISQVTCEQEDNYQKITLFTYSVSEGYFLFSNYKLQGLRKEGHGFQWTRLYACARQLLFSLVFLASGYMHRRVLIGLFSLYAYFPCFRNLPNCCDFRLVWDGDLSQEGERTQEGKAGKPGTKCWLFFSCSNPFCFLLPANLSSIEINNIDSIQRGMNVSLLCIAVPSRN